MFVRIVSTIGAAAAIAALTLTGTASASQDALDRVPVELRMAKVVNGSEPVVQVDKQTYLRGAEKAGVTLTEAEKADVNAAATVCWGWDGWRRGTNALGGALWTSHHKMNWCGDGSWIRVHAYTERWGETHTVGWTDKGLTQQGQQYGVNWNQYNSWTQRKFCLVPYFECIQEANPYHNTTAFPNGATRWN